jgi:hypothetical protein
VLSKVRNRTILSEDQRIRKREYTRIIDSFRVYDVPDPLRNFLLEALHSKKWDWYYDMDGCTGVPDYWPTIYSPECLGHDYPWVTGMGGKESDVIFKALMKAYCKPKGFRWRRYKGVRFAWIFKFKRHHKKKGNIRPLTPAMIEAYNFSLKYLKQ